MLNRHFLTKISSFLKNVNSGSHWREKEHQHPEANAAVYSMNFRVGGESAQRRAAQKFLGQGARRWGLAEEWRLD